MSAQLTTMPIQLLTKPAPILKEVPQPEKQIRKTKRQKPTSLGHLLLKIIRNSLATLLFVLPHLL